MMQNDRRIGLPRWKAPAEFRLPRYDYSGWSTFPQIFEGILSAFWRVVTKTTTAANQLNPTPKKYRRNGKIEGKQNPISWFSFQCLPYYLRISRPAMRRPLDYALPLSIEKPKSFLAPKTVTLCTLQTYSGVVFLIFSDM